MFKLSVTMTLYLWILKPGENQIPQRNKSINQGVCWYNYFSKDVITHQFIWYLIRCFVDFILITWPENHVKVRWILCNFAPNSFISLNFIMCSNFPFRKYGEVSNVFMQEVVETLDYNNGFILYFYTFRNLIVHILLQKVCSKSARSYFLHY